MMWSDRLIPDFDARLESGLRVLAVNRPGQRHVVLVSQILGGSRLDPPGAAGTAHLTEHLLAQGQDRDGRRRVAPVIEQGGTLDATTHPDLLEFCTELPYEVLPAALDAERARIYEWPQLGRGVHARQRDGVCREITDHLARPTRGLPWPALGVPLFGSWSEGHDAFGDAAEVRALTEDDCHEFWKGHHRPARSVVVLVADFGRVTGGFAEVLTRLDGPAHRGLAPPCPIPAQSSSPGITEAADWQIGYSVGALAWRVPSVIDQPEIYAGMLAVAADLSRGGRARLGQMIPMDRADADALTFTVTDRWDAGPALDRAVHRIGTLASGADVGDLERAIACARADLAVRLDRPRAAAQLLGRATLLGDDPLAACHWVEAVHDLDTSAVRESARTLVGTGPVGLVGRPHRSRAEPAPRARTEPASRRRVSSSLQHEGGPRRTSILRIERPSLSAAVAARVVAVDGPNRIADLRARGYRLTEDPTNGWTLERAGSGRADALTAQVGADLSGCALVDRMVVVGEGADDAAPWSLAPMTAPAQPPRPAPPLEVVTSDPSETSASAELIWPTANSRFLERWLGVALLLGIHRRDEHGDIHSLDAPEGSLILPAQRVADGRRELVIHVHSAPGILPQALDHLASELTRERLHRRTTEVPMVARQLAEGWRRDWAEPSVLAQRALVMSELGATTSDVLEFDTRVGSVSGASVAETMILATREPPVGRIRTARPDLLDGLAMAGRRWASPATG